MKKLFLYRLESSDEGTFGILLLNGVYWHSLELPDRDNKPNISRIPKGEYEVSLRYSPQFKRKLYQVKNVKDRTYILFHGANFAGDTKKGFQTHLQGCITLGKKVGRARNRFGVKQNCVFSSRKAIRELMTLLDNKTFKLEIKDI